MPLFPFLTTHTRGRRTLYGRLLRMPHWPIPIVLFGMMMPMSQILQVTLEIPFVHRAFLLNPVLCKFSSRTEPA